MKIVVDQSESRLTFNARPADMDGSVCPDTVWFSSDSALNIDSARLVLMGYLLFEEAVGNSLEFDGIEVPAHVATALTEKFKTTELFISSISNHAQKILPDDYFSCERILAIGDPASTPAENQEEMVWCQPHALGYRVFLPNTASSFNIATNMDLRLSFLRRNRLLLTKAMLLLLLSQHFRVYRMLIEAPEDGAGAGELRALLQEVGLGMADKVYERA